jgi:predicted dehydrogenase
MRHLANLRALGFADLAVVEPDASRRAAAGKVAGAAFATLEEGLEWKPELAIVATPSHLHLGPALALARQAVPLLVEKPLSHAEEGQDDLVREVTRRKLVSLVGCNMRFHPGPAAVKRLLEQGSIGRLLFARIHTGSYLPEWRPAQDYRSSYSAQRSQGGGCLLDCIHEIDLAQWYLGPIAELFCMTEHLSSLEIDAEDVAVILARHAGRALSEIHLDYVQRTYERGCQIVGESGSIFWDFNRPEVRWYDARKKRWNAVRLPRNWKLNSMYRGELEHFVGCVQQGTSPVLPIPEAAQLVRLVAAARESAASQRMVAVRGASA